MKYSFAATAGIVALATAAPVQQAQQAQPPNGYGANFKFPLSNKFPNPGPAAINTLQKQAGGTLPNGPAPPNPGATGGLDFQVIATNELTEVAFFTELLHNITSGVKGYSVDKASYSYVVKAITAIKAQEELHAYSANAVLAAYNLGTIEPCQYTFPVDNYQDAIALAGTFTDLVLGALQAVEADMASIQNPGFAQIVGSIIGQEGEQEGWYRYLQGKLPSSAPFLTNSNGVFAYNALLQNFIVNGSCPQTLPIPILGFLKLTNKVKAANGTAAFEAVGSVDSSMYLTYVSGQDLPVTVPISAITAGTDGATTFTAPFPFAGGFSKGLTVAAVTSTAGPFANSSDVAGSSLFGPGLIEVD